MTHPIDPINTDRVGGILLAGHAIAAPGLDSMFSRTATTLDGQRNVARGAHDHLTALGFTTGRTRAHRDDGIGTQTFYRHVDGRVAFIATEQPTPLGFTMHTTRVSVATFRPDDDRRETYLGHGFAPTVIN